MSQRSQNQAGQLIGQKGAETRRRIMTVAADLLSSQPLRNLRVSDITRSAHTSASTFYLYFQDVADVVLTLLRELPPSLPETYDLDLGSWTPGRAHDAAEDFIEAYTTRWSGRAALMRVRNLAAEEGDVRFLEVRRRYVQPLLKAFAARIEECQIGGSVPPTLHAASTAASLIALLERFAAVAHTQSGDSGITYERSREATAFILASVLTCDAAGSR